MQAAASLSLSALHEPLLAWYDAHRRDLPWRRTSDPYAIWVSEVMLQQTQVATVLPYYERWMAHFPTPQTLAVADEQDALSQWQGLGYYRRCRLLQQGARYVSEHGVPKSADEWLRVPGVGRYTAGAIASIAFGQPVPLVDGNVERVFARLAGCDASGPALHKAAWDWAERNIHQERPGDWNQSLMELGATVCKPKDPACHTCPVAHACVARATGRQQELPTREAPLETIEVRQIVWIPYYSSRFGTVQIPEGQWWQGMWQFPRVDASEAEGLEVPPLRNLIGEGWAERIGAVRHQVTRHKVSVDTYLVRVNSPAPELRWCTVEELKMLPMPNPQRRMLKLALASLQERQSAFQL